MGSTRRQLEKRRQSQGASIPETARQPKPAFSPATRIERPTSSAGPAKTTDPAPFTRTHALRNRRAHHTKRCRKVDTAPAQTSRVWTSQTQRCRRADHRRVISVVPALPPHGRAREYATGGAEVEHTDDTAMLTVQNNSGRASWAGPESSNSEHGSGLPSANLPLGRKDMSFDHVPCKPLCVNVRWVTALRNLLKSKNDAPRLRQTLLPNIAVQVGGISLLDADLGADKRRPRQVRATERIDIDAIVYCSDPGTRLRWPRRTSDGQLRLEVLSVSFDLLPQSGGASPTRILRPIAGSRRSLSSPAQRPCPVARVYCESRTSAGQGLREGEARGERSRDELQGPQRRARSAFPTMLWHHAARTQSFDAEDDHCQLHQELLLVLLVGVRRVAPPGPPHPDGPPPPIGPPAGVGHRPIAPAIDRRPSPAAGPPTSTLGPPAATRLHDKRHSLSGLGSRPARRSAAPASFRQRVRHNSETLPDAERVLPRRKSLLQAIG